MSRDFHTKTPLIILYSPYRLNEEYTSLRLERVKNRFNTRKQVLLYCDYIYLHNNGYFHVTLLYDLDSEIKRSISGSGRSASFV